MPPYETIRATYRSDFVLAALSILLLGAPAISYGASEDVLLEEVVVTARKVEESMQDVSVAVTAFTGTRSIP